MEELLSGAIEHIVFTSMDTGFTVARLRGKTKDPVHIVGYMPGIQPGETILCKGNWKHHPSHGRQFEVLSFELKFPADLLGMQKYLESGMIKGIGPVYAKRIIGHFGLHTLEIIDKTPFKLLEIPGIGEKRVEMIQKCWQDQKSIRDVMIFLRSHDVSPAFAQKIYKSYGDGSIEKMKENPYRLARDIFGVGFKTADKIAEKLGFSKESPIRIDAAIEHLLWELSSEGHVCYPKEELIKKGTEVLGLQESEIEERIAFLAENDRIIEKPLFIIDKNIPFIWIRPLFASEVGISRELRRILQAKGVFREFDAGKALNWAAEKLSLKFAENQKEAILASFKEKTHIITGGPGTGKSTITNAILKISQHLTNDILLAAPTGRAAKRLSEITERKCHTIHSLLEFDFNQGGFKRGRDNPLKCDLIIIDEASMIDTHLMYSLLKAIPSHARVILIGDIDQLPSVGPGNVLRDMIEASRLNVTRLMEIFRQAANSQIIINAHKINQGEFPYLYGKQDGDFFFHEAESPEDILGIIKELVAFKLPQKYNFHPIEDIQVLSPMKKGVIGIENLNQIFQKQLNPSDAALIRMGRSFHTGDKVMQIRNNYSKLTFNGDVGRIESIDMEEECLFVNFDGRIVEYAFSEMDELVLAYAVSVHKYQGSECPCIVMPVHTSHFKLLYRNLLYTGITRGKKMVVLVGTKKAVAIAVRNNEVHKRHTGLRQILQENIPL